jgi:hypothetical protein
MRAERVVNVPTPSVHHVVRNGNLNKSNNKPKKQTSCLRNVVEFLVFILWMVITGYVGYNIGYSPSEDSCPPPVRPAANTTPKKMCTNEKLKPIASHAPLVKDGGFTFDELKTMWKCSHAEADLSEVNKQIFPEDMKLEKTKWKSILTVEPKAFFDKYLTQYPGDTRAVQPVIVFSHKPLNNFEELSDVCKVIDIAIVPDKPGVCVAVTETYHDVASYHMLHADRQTDGSFALTANSMEGRTLPNEKAYSAARALLLDFFKYGDSVQKAVNEAPRYGKGKVAIGCLVEDGDDLELFMNSVASAGRAGISKSKFAVFTSQKRIKEDMSKTGIKIIYMPDLELVGTSGDADVGPKLRRFFLQAWLAFAVSNGLNKIMWQSPGTIWMERPDNIVNAFPAVESLWAYTGRADKRAAPFFASFDFFVPVGVERPIHLLHEIVLHFDLVITWDSIDAVTSYRLSENNSRWMSYLSYFFVGFNYYLFKVWHDHTHLTAVQSATRRASGIRPRKAEGGGGCAGAAPGGRSAQGFRRPHATQAHS